MSFLYRRCLVKKLFKKSACIPFSQENQCVILIKETLRVRCYCFLEEKQITFNFMLNQSEFSNGRDLRNIYIHDSCSQDERNQRQDYFEILKIIILMLLMGMMVRICFSDLRNI